jgi:uncharacterized protein YukE
MGDPLADPRAARLLAADPGEVTALATAFHKVAGQAHSAAAGLRGAQSDATWTGEAAAAFRQQLGKLPGDLDKVQQSYGEVATALNAYEGQLSPLRSQFIHLAEQIRTTRGSLAGAQGTLNTAQGSLHTASTAPHATDTTPAVVTAKSAVSQASGTVNRLQGELDGLERTAYHVLDEFDTARGHARSTVSGAAGIAPSHSWLSGVLHAVGNFVEGAVISIGKSVWNLASGKDIIAFIEHPSWATFGELVKDVAVTASLVAMVAAPFAAPELAGLDGALAGAEGAEAAAAGAEGAAAGAEGAAAGAEGATAGAEGATAGAEGGASAFGSTMRGVTTWGGRVATGGTVAGGVTDAAQGKWADVGVDAAALIVPNAMERSLPTSIDNVKYMGDNFSDALGVGDRAAESSASTFNGLKDYRELTSWGLNPRAAESLAFDKPPSVLSGPARTDPAALNQAITQAQAAALKSAKVAMHVGRPAAIAFDKLVTEPATDRVKEKLSPEPAGG